MSTGSPEQSPKKITPKPPIIRNGMMCCYDMYPTQFGSIDNMTAYLPELKAMGFNMVWLNPIQLAGGIYEKDKFVKRDKSNGIRADNNVTCSLYAMKAHDVISPYFSVSGNTSHTRAGKKKDTQALRKFTDEAKKNGIVPIFDLVLNHVAADSPLVAQYPHWFKEKASFPDSKEFKYTDDNIKEIIETLWRPYIEKYIDTYGFSGVRVDAVGYLDPNLRQRIYEILHECKEKYGLSDLVILDEALMSNKGIEDVSRDLMLPGVGPTHITTGKYYETRQWHGGLSPYCNQEEGNKSAVVFKRKDGSVRKDVQGGCINFCGNHDHNSLAMTVLYAMAHERLEKNHELHHWFSKSPIDKDTGRIDDAYESIYLYHLVMELQQEIADGNQKTIKEVEKRMRDKIAICALTSSGGWYMLSGDETGDTTPKSVFHRTFALDQDYIPQREHKIFTPEDTRDPALVDRVLFHMAEQNLKLDPHMNYIYSQIHDSNAKIKLLAPFLENLKIQINAGDSIVCERFQDEMQKYDIKVTFKDNDYIARPRNKDNGWLGAFDNKAYTLGINKLLKSFPPSQMGFWSELICLPDKPDLVVVIRKNGLGLDAKTDIAIIDLEDKPVHLNKKDLENIAIEFQKRVIPENKRHMGDKEFDLAWHSIMDCTLHVADSISVDNSLKSMLAPPVTEQALEPVVEVPKQPKEETAKELALREKREKAFRVSLFSREEAAMKRAFKDKNSKPEYEKIKVELKHREKEEKQAKLLRAKESASHLKRQISKQSKSIAKSPYQPTRTPKNKGR